MRTAQYGHPAAPRRDQRLCWLARHRAWLIRDLLACNRLARPCRHQRGRIQDSATLAHRRAGPIISFRKRQRHERIPALILGQLAGTRQPVRKQRGIHLGSDQIRMQPALSQQLTQLEPLSFIHTVRVVRRHLPFHAAFSPSAAMADG
jgi:hypothetical protein